MRKKLFLKEFCKKILPKQIINLANKIKNKSISIGRRIEALKIIKSNLEELSVKLKKETPDQRIYRTELFNSIKNIDNQRAECTSLWDKYRQDIRRYILKKDLRNFLRWDRVDRDLSRRELYSRIGRKNFLGMSKQYADKSGCRKSMAIYV